MANQVFAERLNKELDAIGMPKHISERTIALSKMTKLPRFKAQVLLMGSITPNDIAIDNIADELEVSKAWLIGKSANKKIN